MSTNASTKVIIAALIGNAAISITKFFAIVAMQEVLSIETLTYISAYHVA